MNSTSDNHKIKPKHRKAQFFSNKGLFTNLSNFTDLENRILALPHHERGDAFEVFAEAYFNTQGLHQAQELWPISELPQSIKNELGLPSTDMGIDGVFQTHDGNFHAYQVKYRTNRLALTWDELSTFMGLSDKSETRVLFTNSNDISSVMDTRTDFYSVKGNDLDRLDSSDFQEIENFLKFIPISREKKSPRPHQSNAIEDILNEFKVKDRATAIMACAAGKTLIALWVAEGRGAQNILVLLPSLALVRQTLHDWAKEHSLDKFNYLCVCSDATVIKENPEEDEIYLPQHDLDFPVTTDENVIKRFLQNQSFLHKIIFSTYQSCNMIPKSFSFDLGIFDEAHKTAGREGTNFTYALKDENISITKRLFLTATPRHFNVNKKDKEGNSKPVFSMDNPVVYGRICHTLSFARAIEQGIICNYKIIISTIDSKTINRKLLNRGEVIIQGDPTRAHRVANLLALTDAIQKNNVTKIFTFHNSVNAAESFTSDSSDGISTFLNGFKTLHVSGKMSTSERESRMKEFKNAQKAVMSNARCLTEGVNVPEVDMVAFMSPKKSQIDIMQATGRAMRKPEGKKKEYGYIFIPIFLEITNKESIKNALHQTKYKDVWNVLQVLQEHDGILAEIIRKMREDRGRTGGFDDSLLRDKIQVLGHELQLPALQDAIMAMIVEKLGSPWDERFGELITFKEKNGHTNVAKDYTENPPLGIWVDGQRCRYKNKILTNDKIKRLEEIGFNWDPTSTAWEKKFSKLCKFKEANKHSNVPSTYQDKPFATWVTRQRTLYNQGKLTPKRTDLLTNIDFVFEPDNAAWQEQFSRLCQFKEVNNNCNVPQKYPKDPELGRWVTTQRAQFKEENLSQERIDMLNSIGFDWMLENRRKEKALSWEEMHSNLRKSKHENNDCNVSNTSLARWENLQRTKYKKNELTQEQVKKLKEIDFVFEPVNDIAWNNKFNELKKFKNLNGHLNIPWNSNLNKWTTKQRAKYKKNKLSTPKINKLKEIGFNFESIDKKWDEKFDTKFKELCEFKAIEGHTNVPKNSKVNPSLGTWVDKQRCKFKNKNLSLDKIKRLEEIEFDWDPIKSTWEEQFSELQKYKNKFGNTEVPRGFADNPSLAHWVNRQRAECVKGKLPQELIKRLNGAGFVFEPYEAAWEKMFSELCKFKKSNDHCLVPQKYPSNLELGLWVSKQRTDYKKGNLSKERFEKLNELGFVWKTKDPVKSSPWAEWFYDLESSKMKCDTLSGILQKTCNKRCRYERIHAFEIG